MKIKSLITILFLLIDITSSAQKQLNLKKFVKMQDKASGTIADIGVISKILTTKFIAIANDTNAIIHEDIQSFFDDYKLNEDNVENNIYPIIMNKEHLSIQPIDYSNNYGWVGQGADSTFNDSRLTALIIIPAFDNIHKGEIVNTIIFKMTMVLYTESDMKTNKEYKRQERIVELKRKGL